MRLRYFDVLKGMAIFMVVMGHIITMCIREVDRTPIFKFITEIHMPLFFFISGWFTYGLRPDGELRNPNLGKRAKQLLLPMLVVSTLWIYYFPFSGLQSPLTSTFEGLWLSPWKNGYWFTLCLFEIILIFTLIRPLLRKATSIGTSAILLLISWGALFALYIVFRETDIDKLLSLEITVTYWPVFLFGFFASRHREGFDKITRSTLWTTVSLLAGAFILYYLCWWWEFPGVELFEANEINIIVARPLFHIFLAVVAIAVIRPAVENACEKAAPVTPRWVEVWSYLGAKSLGIYLLHYFFLFPMTGLQETVIELNYGFVPVFFFSALCAAAVITVTLGLMRIIAISPMLNTLLTGNLIAKK